MRYRVTQLCRLLLLALLVSLVATNTTQAQELVIEPGEAIVIGALTASREGVAIFGIASELSIRLAHEERPSLDFGEAVFPIEIDHYDSACDDEAAATAAAQLVAENRAVAVIGPNCSGACLAAAPMFDEAGFTNLSPSCSGPSLTENGFRSFLRLTSPNDRIAAPAIRYLKEATSIERLAILRQSTDPYYDGLASATAAEFTALGGAVVVEHTLSEGADPAQFLATAQEAGADAIYCACLADVASDLLSLLAEQSQSLVFMGESHDWAGNLVAAVGDQAEGVYFSSDYPFVFPATRELAARYAERFDAPPQSPYFATAYDAYHLLLDTVRAAGSLADDGSLRIDRAALNEALRNTRDYAGVSGTITCDARGECLEMPTAVLQIREGKYFLQDVTPVADTAQELVIAPGEPIILAFLSNREGADFGEGHVSERGVLLAQEDRASIILDGREVAIEFSDGDSACSAEQAAALAEALVADGRAIGVIGPSCSSACLAAAPIFDAAGFTSLSPSCTAPTLTEQGFTSFHRLEGSDQLLAERAARFFTEELSGNRLALLYTANVNPVFYEGQADSVGDAVLARGGEIVSEIALTAATDFASLLPGLEDAAPDLLYCACAPEAAAALLAALASSPLKDRPLMVVELDDAHQLIELASEAAEGVYAVSSSVTPSEAREALAARYEARFGAVPQSTRYSNAYDAYQLMLDAVETVGVLDEAGALRIDRAALNQVIRNTSDYAGVTGLITCDETGECLRSPTGIYQILDGNLALRITYDD